MYTTMIPMSLWQAARLRLHLFFAANCAVGHKDKQAARVRLHLFCSQLCGWPQRKTGSKSEVRIQWSSIETMSFPCVPLMATSNLFLYLYLSSSTMTRVHMDSENFSSAMAYDRHQIQSKKTVRKVLGM
jgi:hypothetical protein